MLRYQGPRSVGYQHLFGQPKKEGFANFALTEFSEVRSPCIATWHIRQRTLLEINGHLVYAPVFLLRR